MNEEDVRLWKDQIWGLTEMVIGEDDHYGDWLELLTDITRHAARFLSNDSFLTHQAAALERRRQEIG